MYKLPKEPVERGHSDLRSFPLHLAPSPGKSPHLLEATLDAAVLTGDHLAVPVLRGPTGETQVGVALSHRQVARALLGVALGFAAASRKAVLTFREMFFVRRKPCLMVQLKSGAKARINARRPHNNCIIPPYT